jgi:glycosyltransferase involved in cell wall biosynthesis
MIARVFGVVSSCQFVYDQHDLCPELLSSRFAKPRPFLMRLLLWLERRTYRTADHVIATNESYARTAMTRGGRNPDDVTVVRTGPDAKKLRRATADPALLHGRRYLCAYLGVMGPQDGVDYVIRAADFIVHELGRSDISFSLMGTGDCFDELVALRDERGLRNYVEFTGRVPDDVVRAVLSTAHVGLSPDPKNPLNDVSTMNKTMEYMAFELPVVAFDLRETRVSAGASAVYAQPNQVDAYAKAIVELLDDERRRESMGRSGRLRVEHELAWEHQAPVYVGVYDGLIGMHPRTLPEVTSSKSA